MRGARPHVATPTLLAIRGPITGARLQMDGGEKLIGRSPECDITLPDQAVSRRHAVIRKKNLGWIIEDMGSSGGTYINTEKLKAAHALAPNDEVRIGRSIFLFDSDFDLQNADFTDNAIYFSTSNEETLELLPVATLDSSRSTRDSPAQHGMELLTEIGDLFDSSRTGFGDALRQSTERLSRILRSDVAILTLFDHGAGQLRASAVVADGDVLADRAVLLRVFNDKKSLLISDRPEMLSHPAKGAPRHAASRSLLAAPIMVEENAIGVIYFERQELDAYTLKDLRLVQSIGRLLGVFIEARQRSEALTLKINFSAPDSAIIGRSQPFRQVIEMVRRVAVTPSTVLLVGETGSGKEVLASEVHRLSPVGREGGPFIAVNCAAIAETLFESELFGHEKGSFTGAHRLHRGYIEQANGGTLFLDEVGELSLALQPKLLRFLQEHTFMRVGGTRMLRSEVRVVAATNRDLVKEVRAGRFREDLYHRLSVLPIEVPPLRERREDIRLLAENFIQKFGKALGKEVIGLSDDALIALEKYTWPGNVRELANCIERAVLLSDGQVLMPRDFHLGQGARPLTQQKVDVDATIQLMGPLQSLAELEADHILKVLKLSDWNQVKAADILGIHRNTLRKKIEDYGLSHKAAR